MQVDISVNVGGRHMSHSLEVKYAGIVYYNFRYEIFFVYKCQQLFGGACWMPMPGIAMYSATKAYIRAFSRAFRIEMKDYDVSVTVACPGGRGSMWSP